jgi:hypothetical protein
MLSGSYKRATPNGVREMKIERVQHEEIGPTEESESSSNRAIELSPSEASRPPTES